MGDGFTVEVRVVPLCDLCTVEVRARVGTGPDADALIEPAAYDGRTVMGPWAYMCEKHFQSWGVGLGVGHGQRLVLVKSQ